MLTNQWKMESSILLAKLKKIAFFREFTAETGIQPKVRSCSIISTTRSKKDSEILDQLSYLTERIDKP